MRSDKKLSHGQLSLATTFFSAATKGIIITDHDYRNVLDVGNEYSLIFDGNLKRIKGVNELKEWGYINI